MTSDFRETLYTVNPQGVRKWVYAANISGYFRRRRTAVALILLIVYLFTPWLTVGGSQAVFLDIFHRRFTIFGTTFWATDTKFLFLTLASLGFSLFFFTALFGRVWCGWACPETIFLEFIFRPLENWLEGGIAERKKLDSSSWNLRKIRIKGTKYFLYSVISWALASTFLAYFVGRDPLLAMMQDYPWVHWSTFLTTVALMSAVLFQFGWFREQFCSVMCPYARFQSVLLDDSSLLVGYDVKRGEPRGRLSDPNNGDCINCSLCVRVCPTGIDIRNGLQLECIQCAACADACDSVMVKIGRKNGLIRYDTERGLAGQHVSLFRPRLIVYGTLLICLCSFFTYSLITRELSGVAVFHSHTDPLFKVLDSGEISNHLEIHIENKSSISHSYSAVIDRYPQIRVLLPINPFPIPPGSSQVIPVFVMFDSKLLVNGKKSVNLEITDDVNFRQSVPIELIGAG